MSTPTEYLLERASATLLARDDQGRELTIKRPTALDRLRLFKAVGATLAQNGPYFGMAMLAASVQAIDGVPVPAAVTEAQVERIIGQLGEAGISAVATTLSERKSEQEGHTLGN